MKFLKLKFDTARLIKEKNKKNMLGSNRFFHPINKLHVYNSICVLLGRTPKPQLRKTDDKYLPMFDDVLNVVLDGYIKVNLINDSENITTIKKNWDSNITSAKQYTWKDCDYVTGTLLPVFIYHVSNILDKTEDEIKRMPFDEVIENIRSMGKIIKMKKPNKKLKNMSDVKIDKGNVEVEEIIEEKVEEEKIEVEEIVYENEKIKNLISWCKLNSSTTISNYIENKQISSKPTGFGKRVYRGIVNSNKYNGLIFIPLTDELYKELIQYTKGFSNILDGGVVTILGYDEINEDDFTGFIQIRNLNNVRKFEKLTSGVKLENTIYKDLRLGFLIEDINTIITEVGISIINNQATYDEVIKKIENIDLSKDGLKKVAYKINNFIENSINKQYK